MQLRSFNILLLSLRFVGLKSLYGASVTASKYVAVCVSVVAYYLTYVTTVTQVYIVTQVYGNIGTITLIIYIINTLTLNLS